MVFQRKCFSNSLYSIDSSVLPWMVEQFCITFVY